MKLWKSVSICALFACSLSAQIPKPDDAPKPRSPEESAASFKLPPGFQMQVVASEPLIASPSGICWDEQGRMFVSELHGYNLEGHLDIEALNKSGKLDTQVRRVQASEEHKKEAEEGSYGVIKLLSDTDGDRRMDQANIWADDLPPAYGLVAARKGVIVACAPDIVYLADLDGDGTAETRETLFTGFPTGMLERGINAPLWGDDGWIYFGRGWPGGTITGPNFDGSIELPDSDFRIRADGSAIEPVTGGTHTFGFTMTQGGDRFVIGTTVPGIFVAPLPYQYQLRNPTIAAGNIEVRTGDARAYSLAPAHPWRSKRADHPGYFSFYNSRFGAPEIDPNGWFTAACGNFIYRDNALPGLQGQLFACEPSGNLIHRAEVRQDGSALSLHRLAEESNSEFAATTDQWSHPINLLHGPDGAIWVVDYYREIIEDYSAIPRHLQQQYELYNGADLGRIYRLTHKDIKKAPSANLSDLSTADLTKKLLSPIYWHRQTAQRLLVERNRESTNNELILLLENHSENEAAVIPALHVLDRLNQLRSAQLIPNLTHRSADVRIHAIQLCASRLSDSDLLEAVIQAANQESNARVQIEYALVLGETQSPASLPVLADYARKSIETPWMADAILSSVHGRSAKLLDLLLKERGEAGVFIQLLAKSIGASQDVEELESVLISLTTHSSPANSNALKGLNEGRNFAPGLKLTNPRAKAALEELKNNQDDIISNFAASLENSLNRPTRFSSTPAPEIPNGYSAAYEVSDETFKTYTEALREERDLSAGHQVFKLHCALCHKVGEEGNEVGPDVLGEAGVAEESLLRHVIIPNARIRPGFGTTYVIMKDGSLVTGLLKEDGPTGITLTIPGGIQQTLLRKDIERIERRYASMMPPYANIIPPKDMANLLGWIRSQL